MVKHSLLQLFLAAASVTTASGFGYNLTSAGDLSLMDNETEITDIRTIFTDEPVAVSISGIEWEASDVESNTEMILTWETAVGGEVKASGTYNLTELGERELLTDLDCGVVKTSGSGRQEITVTLKVGDESEASTGGEFQTFGKGAAIVPLLVVLILAVTTRMVEFSLFFAIFVGACMVSGEIKEGFKQTLEDYILNALADVGHGYVILFTLFLSGMVGMMEKSGGMIGFTRMIAKHAKTPRAGMAATYVIGCLVFFDDYANTLLAGETMRPLTDLLFTSREKLAFVVDATAAPVASLTPISSWVGFEVGLIQEQIDRLQKLYGDDLTIDTSALAVFMQSIKYRYYPIFMLILMPLLIFSQRDFGTMLIAERRTQVYMRTDGGDGKGKGSSIGVKENQPRPDTPALAHNMAIPIVLLVFFIFYLLVKTGDDGSGDQSFMDKIEASDSYQALLWGTMAAANITTLFYIVQIVYNGELVLPTLDIIKGLFKAEPESEDTSSPEAKELTSDNGEETPDNKNDEDSVSYPVNPRPLMSLFETMEAFLYGMGRIFPALIVLTLAWAAGSVMVAVGADRLFSRWIVNGVSAEQLPTLSFIISGFMALATGTSWGTMSILFPLICVPAYEVSNGDPTIFYATVAGILSGSVAGDHVSPISDTTVLSSLACDCKLLAHVATQAPYAIIVSILAILFGTLPIGRDAWPNIIGILLGALALGLFVYGVCVPIKSPTGRYDFVTTAYLMYKGEDSDLHQLKTDTIGTFSESGDRSDEAAHEIMVPDKTSDDDKEEKDKEEVEA